MATPRDKKVEQLSDQTWEHSEEYQGKTTVYTEAPLKAIGDKGKEELVLRTQSQKLLEKIRPGDVITGFIFKDANAAKFPDTWRFSVRAKDNPDIVGVWDPSGAPQQAREEPRRPLEATQAEDRGDDPLAVMRSLLEQALLLVGQVEWSALVASEGGSDDDLPDDGSEGTTLPF